MTQAWIIITAVLFTAVGADQRSSVSLEIYNRDQALVREVRQVDLSKGDNTVDFQGIAEGIYGHTAHVTPLESLDKITENSLQYNYDLVSHEKLITNFVGRWFTFGSDEFEYEGRLLRIDEDHIFIQPDTSSDEIEVIKRGELVKTFFPGIPEGLFIEPTLRWNVHSKKELQALPVEITYLTSDISWMCDYRAVIAGDNTLELSAAFTLANELPLAFPAAAIALVAGRTHRSEDPENTDNWELAVGKTTAGRGQEKERFFEYYRFVLPDLLDLGRNQTIKVPFFEPAKVKVRKKFVYPHTLEGSQVQVRLQFENTGGVGPERALPEGDVGIYQVSADGGLSFLGEDFIEATPAGGEVDLMVGAAFDLTARRMRMGQSRPQRNQHEETWKVEINSARNDTTVVEVEQRVFGYYNVLQGEVDGEKADYIVISADRIMFPVRVEPQGKSVLTFSLSFGY